MIAGLHLVEGLVVEGRDHRIRVLYNFRIMLHRWLNRPHMGPPPAQHEVVSLVVEDYLSRPEPVLCYEWVSRVCVDLVEENLFGRVPYKQPIFQVQRKQNVPANPLHSQRGTKIE